MKILSHQAHVWLVKLALNQEDIAFYNTLLDDDEKTRADKFYFPLHKTRFIAGRGQLRMILSYYMAIDPAQLLFSYTDKKKPFIANQNFPKYQFNLSHSRDQLILAITLGYMIGVDIEYAEEKSILSLSQRFFSPLEQNYLASLNSAEQLKEFYRIWVGKEALLKASGLGLTSPLNAFTIPPQITDCRLTLKDKTWFLYFFPLIPSFASALACEQNIQSISFFRLNSGPEHLKDIYF